MNSKLPNIIKWLLATIEPATSNHYLTRGVGIHILDESASTWTVTLKKGDFAIQEGLHEARFVISGTQDAFEKLRQDADASALFFTPHDWRLYMPPPLRPIFKSRLDQTQQTFSMPHQYPVALNHHLYENYQAEPIPDYSINKLPRIIVKDYPLWEKMYDYAWQIAFKNLRTPEPASGFVANFIDTAFNTNTFIWDSCFMTMFGKYSRQVFDFMGTLDNFYAKQHADGFICREINTYHGSDLYDSIDPRSTGPNIFAWTEWHYYLLSDDKQRLKSIFPALVGYHRWWKQWRTWPDGSYWTSGLGSGMDNQTRVPDSGFHHRHATWLDAMCQQALNINMLLKISSIIKWDEFDEEFHSEYANIQHIINETMWDEDRAFYFDKQSDGTLGHVKSIGAYWGLLAHLFPHERAAKMIDHLQDVNQFNRRHRIPSQAADNADYQADGNYWMGGVWSPTNYMVLHALSLYGEHDLAHEIALNHVGNVAQVFENTGTLWENYAPEAAEQGSPAKDKFVGWTGLSAINIPIEYVIGIRQENDALLWDVRLRGEHGVERYPLDEKNSATFICKPRASNEAPPQFMIETTTAIQLTIKWRDDVKNIQLAEGFHEFSFAEVTP